MHALMLPLVVMVLVVLVVTGNCWLLQAGPQAPGKGGGVSETAWLGLCGLHGVGSKTTHPPTHLGIGNCGGGALPAAVRSLRRPCISAVQISFLLQRVGLTW